MRGWCCHRGTVLALNATVLDITHRRHTYAVVGVDRRCVSRYALLVRAHVCHILGLNSRVQVDVEREYIK